MKPAPGIPEKRVAVVIPAYRAERHIVDVLAGVPESVALICRRR